MITVIGNGSWATALVKILADNNHAITWWMRSENDIHFFENHHKNAKYLSSVDFSGKKIKVTANLIDAINEHEIILICVPSAFISDVLKDLPSTLLENKQVISAIKGIVPSESQLLNQFLHKRFNFNELKYTSITGPCHAEEVASEKLSYLTFSNIDESTAQKMAGLFRNSYLNTSINTDIWGTQFAAILKNVYALGSGIAKGLGYGENFASVLICNGFSEVYNFLENIHKLHYCDNQIVPNFNLSAYLGDLLVTAYSMHSRNRRFGIKIGEGFSVQEIEMEMNMIAEGYFAVKEMHGIAQKMNIQMPILNEIYKVLYKNLLPDLAFKQIENILK